MKRWEMDGDGRNRLELRDVPKPTPKPGEVLVKVAAVALNYRDQMMIEGGRELGYPFTPASDLSGTVEAMGEGALRFRTGESVISTAAPGWIDGAPLGNARTPRYQTLGGAYPGVLAEYVAFPEDWFVRAPASLDHAQASTLPCAGLTAWFALVERGKLHAGQTVLIEGTGGVALFGLQIAKAHGARTIVVSGNREKLERTKELGADHGFERSAEDWVDAVYRLTNDEGAQHVLELVGGPHLGRAARAAAAGGQIYQIGVFEGFEASFPTAAVMLKQVTIHGISLGHRRALEEFAVAIDRTGLKPVIDRRYPFSKLSAALDHLAAGPFGKIVIEI
jgi:NADPH:quinone reductase-like Zn-dependent oxidoreductase